MLIPMVLEFVWSSSVIKPVSVLVIVISILVVLVSLIVSRRLLVSFISSVVPVESLSILVVLAAGVTVIPVIDLELCDELKELFLCDGLLNELFQDLFPDLLLALVLIALMSKSWNESSSSLICVSILVLTWSLDWPVAASTKELSLLMSMACLNASSNVLMYEFFFANFLNNLPLVFVGNFFAYSISMVLLPLLSGRYAECYFVYRFVSVVECD